jgi:hypothetical protein
MYHKDHLYNLFLSIGFAPDFSHRKNRKKTTSAESSSQVLAAYAKELRSRFPDLASRFSCSEDPRKRKAYSMEEILMGGIGMFLLRQGSRNSINNKRREDNFRDNYRQCFCMRLPHQDTVADVLCRIDPVEMEQVKMDLFASFFEQKWLRPYRLLDRYYMVAVDATGVVSFDHPHCEH